MARPRAPRTRPGRGEDRRELLLGPFELALLHELRVNGVAQVDEHLDVQGGVAQPGLRERTGRPVGGRVALLERQAEDLFDERPETDPGVTRQAGAELGVEDPLRAHPDVTEARQVLAGGVEHPLGADEGRVQAGEVGTADRIDQSGARPGAPELDQIGPLAVAVARRPLGVDRHRAAAGREGGDRPREGRGVLDDGGQPVPGLQERCGFGACRDVVLNIAGRGLGHRARA
jgi:hypothetical protein